LKTRGAIRYKLVVVASAIAIQSLEEQNAELLRRLAALEARQNSLEVERDAAVAERDAVTSRLDKLKSSYDRLLEQHVLLKRRVFMAKAERVDSRQLELEFAEVSAKLEQAKRDLEAAQAAAEEAATSDADDKAPPKQRRRPKGRRNLDLSELPKQRVELPNEQFEALVAEGKAARIGFEESFRLGYERGGARCVVMARAKYKLMSEEAKSTIVTTEMPPEIMQRGMLAPSMIAHILAAKYCYGLPFHRQMEMLAGDGIDLDDSLMGRYAEHVGATLGAIVEACAKDAKENSFCLSTDATGVSIQPAPLADRSRQPCKRGHFFVVLADQDHVFFEYTDKHNSAAVCSMFKGYSGYIQADAHSVYHALYRGEALDDDQDEPPDEVGCWSHTRRKFWEAATVSKEPIAQEAMLRLKKLFEIEASFQKMAPSKRKKKRQAILKPLIVAFFEWVHAQHAVHGGVRCLLSSATGYATRHEESLMRFLEDGRLKMTNNHSERALRPIAVGRKNWLFFGSSDHADAAANLFSLIASCKLHGLDPETYLAEIIHVMPQWPRDRYLELCPRDWAATRSRIDPTELESEIGWITMPQPLAAPEQQSSTD